MKISLCFDIFNKEDTIADVIDSWLNSASGNFKIELICVYDALTDHSDWEVSRLLTLKHRSLSYFRAIYTDDVFEVKANNAALDEASGDVVVFAQDDNFQYTQNWDYTLFRLFHSRSVHPVGAIGLLAGVQFNKDFSLSRIECDRPHKGDNFSIHGISPDTYPLAAYSVDVINRPFAIRTQRLRDYSGLDEAYCPMDWDDADLSLKLLRDGYTNLYIPFDVVNTCAKKETLSRAQMDANYIHGERIARERWGKFVAVRETSFKLLMPLTEDEQGRLILNG